MTPGQLKRLVLLLLPLLLYVSVVVVVPTMHMQGKNGVSVNGVLHTPASGPCNLASQVRKTHHPAHVTAPNSKC
jgi:hypothetical protein